MTIRSTLSALAARFFTRSFDAAAGGRRWEGAKTMTSVNALLGSLPTVRARVAHAVRNQPWLQKGVAVMATNLTGTGIRAQAKHPDETVRKLLNARFERFADSVDVAGRTDFWGMQGIVARCLVQDGEAFIRVQLAPGPTLTLQMIHPDQVDAALNRDLDGGRRIRGGIELDADGRPLAYHVLAGRPGDPMTTRYDIVRIPAEEMLHVFRVEEPGQIRGVPWLASVLLKARDYDEYEDAQLMRQKCSAMIMGVVVDPLGNSGRFSGTKSGNVLESGLEPGTLKVLPPGFDVKFLEPAAVGDNSDFMRTQLRAIAAGIGCTYEQLTGDLSNVNYSSLRGGTLEFRSGIDAVRWGTLVPQFLSPIWRAFIRRCVLDGTIAAAEYQRDPDSFTAVSWHPPAWPWVSPSDDIAAEQAAVDAGFKSRSAVINERGEDPEMVDRDRAADLQRAERLGLTTPSQGVPANG